MMRIGIFTHYIDKYPKSAPSLYQLDLVKKLIERTNFDIVLIHHRRTDLPIYKMTEEAVVSKVPYLREHEINKLDLDLIHFNAIPWSWWPSITRLSTPSVVTVHGTIHWDASHLDDYTSPLLRFLKRVLEKQVSRHISHFIAISRHVRKVLINRLKVPNDKIETIYLPIDRNTFRPLDKKIVEKVKAKYSIKSKYIMHVSTFSRRKNPEVLLKSFSIVKRKVRDMMLVIVGSNWDNPFVLKLANEFNLQNYVKILGWIPRKDLVALYNGAELLLFPSLHENFGFPVVEAMACGTPVVASNVFAIPEVCGDACILCDPNDYECFVNAVLKILSDSCIHEEMVKKGFEKVALFDWSIHIDMIIYTYRRVANQS